MVNTKNRSDTSSVMTRDLKHTLGLRLRDLRNAQNITQETLAEMVERTPETISNIERGKFLPSLETLARIADGLGVPLGSFFEKDEKARDTFIRAYEVEFRLRKALEPLSDDDVETALVLLEAYSDRRRMTFR